MLPWIFGLTLAGVTLGRTHLVSAEGSVVTEGDSILKADLARAIFAVDGSRIRVGVISDGVAGLEQSKATGDLPADTCGASPSLEPDLCRGIGANLRDGAEGTAMMEIIHDLAPGAELMFCAPATSVDMVDCVDFLASEAGGPNSRRGSAGGVDVIVDDLGFFLEPYFEDGMIAQAYADASARGVLMVSAGGNEARIHYQGFYNELPGGGGFHDFGGGDSRLRVSGPKNALVTVILQWSNAFGASADDYNLYFFDADGTLVASSTSVQNGDDDPLEILQLVCDSDGCAGDVAITKNSGADQELELFILGINSMEHVVIEDSVFGHPAVEGAVATGAISAADPDHDTIESFSSRGHSTIYFPSFEQRLKPDLSSIDGISVTGNGGFPSTFFGTSAAAPHAAAVAALILDLDPNLTPPEVKRAIEETAVRLGSPVPNGTFGHGRIDALAALNGLLIRSVSANQERFSGGESLTVSVKVNNPGAAMTVDFYFGAVLPDGDTIVYFTDLKFNSALGNLSDLATLSPIAGGVDLSVPFIVDDPLFFTYTWTGAEPLGTYTLFLAAVVPGAFTDGSVDPEDIIDWGLFPFIFGP